MDNEGLRKKTLSRFNKPLNTLELEKQFWEASGELDCVLGKGSAREGKGLGKPLIEEVFALIQLGKSSLTDLRRITSSLEFETNLENKKTNKNEEFDASYHWKEISNQPFSISDSRGYIEITTCISDAYQESLENEYLTKHGSALGNAVYARDSSSGEVIVKSGGVATDISGPMPEFDNKVIEAFKKKANGNYPKNTLLVIWLKDSANVRYESRGNFELITSELNKLNNEKFAGVFLAGWHFSGRWLLGERLL